MILETKNLCKSFSKLNVINDVSIRLGNGVYGLLGPNGAGKTTLIRLLAGVMNPDSGEILMNGISKQKCGKNYYDKIGYLPQDVDFYNNFTGLEYLNYVATLKGLSPDEASKRIEHLVEQVNLTKDINRKCVKYSGGMKKRLGIAQALLNDPEILILDEPTAGLDPYERIKFRNIISAFSSDRTVILSTHIVSDISSISKSILMLKDHTIMPIETQEEIIEHIADCVWEVNIPVTELIAFQNNHIIGNIKTENDMACLRVISSDIPESNAIPLEPNLEDAYLYEFNLQN